MYIFCGLRHAPIIAAAPVKGPILESARTLRFWRKNSTWILRHKLTELRTESDSGLPIATCGCKWFKRILNTQCNQCSQMTLAEHMPRTKHWQRQTQYKRLHRKGPTQTIARLHWECHGCPRTCQRHIVQSSPVSSKYQPQKKTRMKRPENQENEDKVMLELLERVLPCLDTIGTSKPLGCITQPIFSKNCGQGGGC